MSTIFIASATAALPLVSDIGAWLEKKGHRIVRWDADVFRPGDLVLDTLVTQTESVDGAIFVFSAEDKGPVNDNVLMEFGLFFGRLGRQNAIICRDGNPKNPTDIAGITYIDVSQDRRLNGRRELEMWADRLEPRRLVNVTSSFPNDLFRQRIADAREVRILQTFIPVHMHMALFESELAAAIRRGCDVEVLLCDPWSSICQIRQNSLGGPCAIQVRAEIERNIRHLSDIYEKLPESRRDLLKVRVYSTLPPMAIYQVDDRFLCGAYFHGLLAIDAPQLEVRGRNSPLGARLETEHRRIWDDRKTRVVPLDDVEAWIRAGAGHPTAE